MKRLTPQEFWAVFSKDYDTFMVVNPVCRITFETSDFYKFMDAYAEHIEATAWVIDGSLPPRIEKSSISVNCIIDCGFAKNYVGYYHFGLNQWRHCNNVKPIEHEVLQYYPIPFTPPKQ